PAHPLYRRVRSVRVPAPRRRAPRLPAARPLRVPGRDEGRARRHRRAREEAPGRGRPRQHHRREVPAHARRGVEVRAHERVHRLRPALHGGAPAHRIALTSGGRLAGKVAIVTGAARGTGAAIAREFVAEGATVVVADVLDDRGEATASGLGAAARYHHLDVTDADGWNALLGDLATRGGHLDVLVNNAAVLHLATIDRTAPDEFERVMRVNCFGAFLATQR